MSASDIIDENDAEVCLQQSILQFRRLCRRLGMVDAAAPRWEQWHVRALPNMIVCMGSCLACWVLLLVTFTLGCSLDRWYPHVLVFAYGVIQGLNMLFFWRRGPGHSDTRFHFICIALVILLIFAVSIPAIAGPLALVPFKNRLAATTSISLAIWLFLLSGYTGGSAESRPAVPHTAFTGPLLTATWVTVRIMDPVTDMVLVRLMLELVCSWKLKQSTSCATFWM